MEQQLLTVNEFNRQSASAKNTDEKKEESAEEAIT
jgi:hypothetical protein